MLVPAGGEERISGIRRALKKDERRVTLILTPNGFEFSFEPRSKWTGLDVRRARESLRRGYRILKYNIIKEGNHYGD